MAKKILTVMGFLLLILASCSNKQKLEVSMEPQEKNQEKEPEVPDDEEITPPADRVYIKFLCEEKYGLLDSQLNVIKKNDYKKIWLINDFIFFAEPKALKISDLDLKSKATLSIYSDGLTNIFYLTGDYYCLQMYGENDYVYDIRTGEKVPHGSLYPNHSNVPTSFLQPVWLEGYYVSLLDGSIHFNERNYEKAFQFSNGLAAVLTEEWTKTLINEDGMVMLDDVINCAPCFYNGLMPVITKTASGYINANCEFVFECDLVNEDWKTNVGGVPSLRGGFLEDYAYVHTRENSWTIMARDGTVIKDNIPYETRSVGFRCGLIKVYSNGKSGYVNRAGELAIPMIFDSAEDFVNGYAIVNYDGEDGVLDTDGNIYLSKDLLDGNKTVFANVMSSQ